MKVYKNRSKYKTKRKKVNTDTEEIVRVRLPKKGEFFGNVVMLMGGSRLQVDCEDEKTRICRIPGKFKRRMWVRPGDYVIIEPWTIQSDERADVLWRYTRGQVEWLKRHGYLKNI